MRKVVISIVAILALAMVFIYFVIVPRCGDIQVFPGQVVPSNSEVSLAIECSGYELLYSWTVPSEIDNNRYFGETIVFPLNSEIQNTDSTIIVPFEVTVRNDMFWFETKRSVSVAFEPVE